MKTRSAVRTEWVTLGFILACYGLWVCAGLLWTTPYWALGLITMPFLAAFQTSLQHETIHGHPTPFTWLNETLVSLPIAGVFPYRRYKDLHLKHHQDEHLTDPYEDPESYFWCEHQVRDMNDLQRHIFSINNTFVGRLAIGPALTIIGFTRTEWWRFRQDQPGVRMAWLLHIIGLIPMLWIVIQIFAMQLWVYFFCVVYPAMSLIAVRSYAEHQAAENVGSRSAIVETHPLIGLLYLNNNLHVVHHASPTTPWYDIPRLYRERKQQYLAANGNTLFNGYRDIARRFAFSVKQPVAHPIMYRAERTSHHADQSR